MDRPPGLSVRLKLTLSYAGFLMVAGFLLLAAVWLFLLRYVPENALISTPVPGPFPIRSNLLHVFAPRAAAVLAFLLLFGLVGGWLLAGRMLAPLARITDATRIAASGSLSHRIRLPGRTDEFRELADAFDAMLARLEAHVVEQQRFAANASHELRTPLAITQTLLDVARNDPNRDSGELDERLRAVNARAIDLTEALLVLSRADQRSFVPEHVDLSLIAEEAAETLLPLAEKRGVTIETIRRHDAHHRLTRTAAADGYQPRAQRDRPQPAQTGHRARRDQRSPQEHGAHRREHRREARPTVGFHVCRAVSARQQTTHPHRPRGRRPRPGHRQEHQPSTRRHPHSHPADRRGLRVTVQLPAAPPHTGR